jgi:hypothetical protein
MSYYMLRPCRTAVGFIATPRGSARLDLKRSGEALRRAGYSVLDVNVLLLIRGEPEITLYESGKILVKTGDECQARAAVEGVYSALGFKGPRG